MTRAVYTVFFSVWGLKNNYPIKCTIFSNFIHFVCYFCVFLEKQQHYKFGSLWQTGLSYRTYCLPVQCAFDHVIWLHRTKINGETFSFIIVFRPLTILQWKQSSMHWKDGRLYNANTVLLVILSYLRIRIIISAINKVHNMC